MGKWTLFVLSILLSGNAWALTLSAPALDDRWKSVVLIRTDAVDTDGSPVPAYCNGALLSPHLLLTAAHCVLHAEVIRSFQVQIEVGHYKYVAKPDGSLVRVGYVPLLKDTYPAQFHFVRSLQEKIRDSGLKTQIAPDEDIAVVELKKEMPLEPAFPFARVAGRAEFESVSQSPLKSSPTVVSVNYFSEMSTDTKRMAALDDLRWSSPSHFESRSRARVEEGDSGAPLWAQVGQSWEIVGVVKGRAETIFSNWDVFGAAAPDLCAISADLPSADAARICY